MKILIINGSNRKHGSTASILHMFYEVLKMQEDVDVSYLDVADLSMRYCIGCGACYHKGSCVFSDDIEKVSAEIGKADGLILGSPTYASNVSAQMKTIIDRGHFVMEQLLYGAYAISVSTYENYGGKETSKILNRLLSYSGARIVKRMVVKLPFSTHPDIDLHMQREIQKAANRFYRDILHQRAYRFQAMKHYLLFHLGIVPFVKKKGAAYAGVLQHWHNKKRKVK